MLFCCFFIVRISIIEINIAMDLLDGPRNCFSLLLRIMMASQLVLIGDASYLWERWWNYEGISGPLMWGSIRTEWYMCSRGKNQSPINIDPNILLFDPHLKHISMKGDVATGILVNYGVELTLEFNTTLPQDAINITMGPLSYNYRLGEIKFHFGSFDGEGSEHSVNGEHFDGEMHLVAYNADIFKNVSHAQTAPRGLAIIAVFLQVGTPKVFNDQFARLVRLSETILYKGQRATVRGLNVRSLLPRMDNFITYEGSLTSPGCQESVTWIVLNKPITVTHDQMEALRSLRQRDISHPQMFMADNYRPIMPLNNRSLRTNINFVNSNTARGCSMSQEMQYQFNGKLRVKK